MRAVTISVLLFMGLFPTDGGACGDPWDPPCRGGRFINADTFPDSPSSDTSGYRFVHRNLARVIDRTLDIRDERNKRYAVDVVNVMPTFRNYLLSNLTFGKMHGTSFYIRFHANGSGGKVMIDCRASLSPENQRVAFSDCNPIKDAAIKPQSALFRGYAYPLIDLLNSSSFSASFENAGIVPSDGEADSTAVDQSNRQPRPTMSPDSGHRLPDEDGEGGASRRIYGR